MHNHYSDSVKQQALDLVIEQGLSISDVAQQLNIGSRSIYNWLTEVKKSENASADFREFLRLKKELAKITAERDLLRDLILKIAANKDTINDAFGTAANS